MTIRLEHVNITVTDPEKTARMLCDLFDWKIRWHGDAINGGITYHVGTDEDYLAVYSSGRQEEYKGEPYDLLGGLNHVGVVVEDIDAMEQRVIAAGFEPHNHADYEPGKRFYFHDGDGIEFEVVSYG